MRTLFVFYLGKCLYTKFCLEFREVGVGGPRSTDLGLLNRNEAVIQYIQCSSCQPCFKVPQVTTAPSLLSTLPISALY